ncbi:hypothetical protein [Myroides sp. LJL119]
MKKNILAVMTLLLSVGTLQSVLAQDKPVPAVGIGTKKVNPSAILDIDAKNKGVLIPRVSLTGLNNFGLNGDSANAQSLLVFNENVTSELKKGFYYWENNKWQLIVSETHLEEVINKLELELNNKIDNITNFGTSVDKSYLVSFKPSGSDQHSGSFSYLKPEFADSASPEKITGYTLVSITLEDLVQGSETLTFIREIKGEVKQADGSKVEEVVAYVYFSEEAIKTWRSKLGNESLPLEKMDDSDGFIIDVQGIVSSTFIDNLELYNNYIKNIVNNQEGFLVLQGDGVNDQWKFVRKIKDPNSGLVIDQDVDFNKQMETPTQISVARIQNDGDALAFQKYTSEPGASELVKGKVFYEYLTETNYGKEKNYIDLTADIKHAVTNNIDLQNSILNVFNELTEGGNVYYGVVGKDASGDDIFALYTYNSDTGARELIDIEQNIINSITNNETVKNKILSLVNVDITYTQDRVTNTTINGEKVFKGVKKINIKEPYDSTMENPVEITPFVQNGKVDPQGNWLYEAVVSPKIKKILKIEVLDAKGMVVISAVTDVEILPPNKFTAYFGQGIMYVNLLKGEYDILYEYTLE